MIIFNIISEHTVPRGETDRRTDRHDETNSRFSQVGERAQKPDIRLLVFIYAISYFNSAIAKKKSLTILDFSEI